MRVGWKDAAGRRARHDGTGQEDGPGPLLLRLAFRSLVSQGILPARTPTTCQELPAHEHAEEGKAGQSKRREAGGGKPQPEARTSGIPEPPADNDKAMVTTQPHSAKVTLKVVQSTRRARKNGRF